MKIFASAYFKKLDAAFVSANDVLSLTVALKTKPQNYVRTSMGKYYLVRGNKV